MSESQLIRSLMKMALGVAGEGVKAALSAVNIARNIHLLNKISIRGAYAAGTSIAAGDHPYAILLNYYAAIQGQKAALIQGDRSYTYREMRDRFNQLSHVLDELGVKPGDRVLVMMGNSPDWILAAAAIGNVGAKLIPVSTALKAPALSYIVEHALPRAIICDSPYQGVVNESILEREALRGRVLVRGEAADIQAPFIDFHHRVKRAPVSPLPKPEGRSLFSGLVMYTSGTTGNPKGVERDDSTFDISIVSAIDGLLDNFGFHPEDICFITTPMYHAAPLLFLAVHLALGATVVVGDSAKADDIIDALKRHRVSNSLLVPTLLTRLVNHGDAPTPQDFPYLRAIFSTAAPLPVAVAEGIRERFGEVLHDFYGATETGLVTFATPQDLRSRPGTVGKPSPGAKLFILGEDHKPVAQGEVGELYARTGLSMGGYRGDREATERAAWDDCFSVGDKAYQDKDGYVFIVGRHSELIITGGVNVYPAEIENQLIRHPQVNEVSVMGITDPEWGECVHAVVAASDDKLNAEDLKDWVKTRLSKAQAPKVYHFVPSLPHSPQGKVKRRQLKVDIENNRPLSLD